nr:ATP synthase F0 subunit C [Helcococcus sueciensis]
MNKKIKLSALLMVLVICASFIALTSTAFAQNNESATEAVESTQVQDAEDSAKGAKGIASGIAIGLTGLGGALAMGMAISKAADGISRQPEADNKIRTTLMLGLVFIETVVIYALIVAILIIFVL